ncbi:MAG: hypothetical protein GDA44_08040 [Prochloron sp. SP5CPC1]|nr:hypothetical protein [Candidatus Paraprochloron terpiosi SP5CPC1]
MKCLTNPLWYEIVIPDLLTGQFVANFLKLVQQYLQLNFVVLQYLEGVDISELYRNHDSKIEELDMILKLVNQAGQIIWCDFLLFEQGGFIPDDNEQYDKIIERTNATVRAVDGGYLYLYTKNKKLVQKILKKFEEVELTEGTLNQFTLPE